MSVTPDPGLCTESINENYTIGTFHLYARPAGGLEIDIGNIQTGSFQVTPNILEHRRGIDNSLDAIFRIGTDYIINFTGDEISIANLGLLLNEDLVATAAGCKAPFTGSRCVKEYGIRLTHDFAGECPGDTLKTLTIIMWRAVILSDSTFNFDPGANTNFDSIIRALSCASVHPAEPYGYAEITEPCPAS